MELLRGVQLVVFVAAAGALGHDIPHARRGRDPLVGDGAGCLIQIPDALLRQWATEKGLTLPPAGGYSTLAVQPPLTDAATPGPDAGPAPVFGLAAAFSALTALGFGVVPERRLS